MRLGSKEDEQREESIENTETGEKRLILGAENTHRKGKNHCTVDLLFDWFGFEHTSKIVVHST